MTDDRGHRIRGIYVLADDDPARRHPPRTTVEAALEAGVSTIQLRIKHATDHEALELCRWAVSRSAASGAAVVVNDRFDLADLAGARGVHLGDQDLPPERIPAALRERLLVGLSTHTLEQVRASVERPIDYVAFGPVFGTRSKQSSWTPRGIELLAEAVELARHPLVAIGGITLRSLKQVRAAGAAAAAVIAAVGDAEDPVRATRELIEAFAEGAS